MPIATPKKLRKDRWLTLREVQKFLTTANIYHPDAWVRSKADDGTLPCRRAISGDREWSYNGVIAYINEYGTGSTVPSMARRR